MRNRLRPASLLLMLAPFCAAWAQTQTLPPGAVLVEPRQMKVSSAQVDGRMRAALSALARSDVDGALAALRAGGNAMEFEFAAVASIDQLIQQPSTSTSERFLAQLEREPVRLWQRHEETAADWFVPLLDVPGRAASARRLSAFVRERDALGQALERDASKVSLSEVESSTLAAAIDGVSAAALARLVPHALDADDAFPSAAWVALARREPSAAVLEATLAHADPVDLLPLLQALPSRLPTALAFDWLERALEHEEVASAAMLALGRLAPRSAAAEAAVVKRLGDPRLGDSAAAALAQMPTRDRMDRIDGLLAKAGSPAVLADLALALRLEGSPPALQRLEALAKDPRINAALKRELQR